jgi:hypothetical protein
VNGSRKGSLIISINISWSCLSTAKWRGVFPLLSFKLKLKTYLSNFLFMETMSHKALYCRFLRAMWRGAVLISSMWFTSTPISTHRSKIYLVISTSLSYFTNNKCTTFAFIEVTTLASVYGIFSSWRVTSNLFCNTEKCRG